MNNALAPIRLGGHDWPEQPIVPVCADGFSFSLADSEADALFIDQMQKHFKGHLGFLWNTAIAKAIERKEVLMAKGSGGVPYGFIMGTNRYQMNDQCAFIKQLAVVPMKHRKQLGSQLVREFIRRLPYGTRLISCWTAQDLPANYFWEAIGFIPIAFRTGSRTQRRIQLFWQRRTRVGDTQTPFWFPSKTSNGAVAEERIVVPVPPGTSWQDAKPVLLPDRSASLGLKLLPNGMPDPKQERAVKAAVRHGTDAESKPPGRLKESVPHFKRKRGAIRLVSSRGVQSIPVEGATEQRPAKKKRQPRAKADEAQAAAARELRDRYLEEFNQCTIQETGKYQVARRLEEVPSVLPSLPTQLRQGNLLPSASVASSSPQSSPSAPCTDAPCSGTSSSQTAEEHPDS